MKKLFLFIATFIVVILIIPLFALVGSKSLPLTYQEDPKEDQIYKILNHQTGQVMSLTPSEYIKGVVAAEMPISFHVEAIKAQAVASHTYTLRQIDVQIKKPSEELKGAFLTTEHTINQAYLSVEEMKQKWGSSFDVNYQKLSDAVDSVINQAIVYEDKPIIAAFHSISGGITESAQTVWGREVAYLTPVESLGDELSPNYETDSILTRKEVEHAFKQAFKEITFEDDAASWFAIKTRSESKTVTEIKVGSLTLSGREVRETLKLKSANFTVEYANDSFTFKTNGYGHGVGMSQYGADYLARQGKTYEEILLHYYSGVSLKEIYTNNSEK